MTTIVETSMNRVMTKRASRLPTGGLAALVASGLIVLPVCAPAASSPALPVFRQALEQWSPSDYEMVVFHRGSMTDESQTLVDSLREARAKSGLNATIRTVDVAAEMTKEMDDLWTGQGDPQPPWMVVRAPDSSPDAAPVWTGPLTAAAVRSLIDSPARRKIAEGLLQGATAVWVLLECGEAARDEAAVDVLSSTLKALEKKIVLPKPGPLRSALPLHIDFDLVRVTRSDPAEEFFVTLLEHGKPSFSSRPVAFPVFGRGRSLGALVGREIDAEGIGAVAALLTGAARDGKESTPGRDLLLAAEWKRIYSPAVAGQTARPEVTTMPDVAPATAIPASAEPGDGLANWVVILGVIVVGAAALSFVLLRKPRHKPGAS